jgi:hypothetical protein
VENVAIANIGSDVSSHCGAVDSVVHAVMISMQESCVRTCTSQGFQGSKSWFTTGAHSAKTIA